MLVHYNFISHCFFNKCEEGNSTFVERFFTDKKIKVVFGVNVGLIIIAKYVFLKVVSVFNLSDDENRVTPSEYTLLVGNIEKTQTSAELGLLLETTVPGVKVHKVNYIYSIKHFYSVVQRWMDLERDLTILESKGRLGTKKYEELDR